MKDDLHKEPGKIAGIAKRSGESDGKITGFSQTNIETDGKITGDSSSIVPRKDIIDNKSHQLKTPISRKERIAAATVTGGINNLPPNFGDSDGDWKVIESDNLFEILYLDHSQIISINPDIVKNNYLVFEKFWKEKKNLWETSAQTIRQKIESLYGEKNLTNCLNRLQIAYQKFSTIQGITEYYEKFKEKRLKDGLIKLDSLLKMMIKDGEADVSEIEQVFNAGLNLDFSDEEVAIVIKSFLDSNNFLAYRGNPSGNNLKEQLFSISWLTDEKRIQKEKDDEEKKKRGREIFDNIFAYSTEEIGEILYKYEAQAKEYIQDGLVINSIDYFSSAKAKQIIDISRKSTNDQLRYIQIIYRLNPNLPYKFKGKECKDINELILALFEDPEIGKKHIAHGSIGIWLMETQKDSYEKFFQILDKSENIDLAFLNILYTFNPKLPYRFAKEYLVNTSEELCLEINKNSNNWNAGKEELFNSSILVWLSYVGFTEKIKSWNKIKHIFGKNNDLGLEEFLHILNEKYEYAHINVNKSAISFQKIQSGDKVTADILIENEKRGYTDVNISFSKILEGVSISKSNIAFNTAAGVSKYNLKVNIETSNLLKGVEYKTILHLKTSANQNIDIPVSFEVVFPQKAFIWEIARYSTLVSIFFILVRLFFSADYSDWLINYDKHFFGWDFVEVYYKNYSEFGWTFLFFLSFAFIGLYLLIKYLRSNKTIDYRFKK